MLIRQENKEEVARCLSLSCHTSYTITCCTTCGLQLNVYTFLYVYTYFVFSDWFSYGLSGSEQYGPCDLHYITYVFLTFLSFYIIVGSLLIGLGLAYPKLPCKLDIYWFQRGKDKKIKQGKSENVDLTKTNSSVGVRK